jgi:hypothetical protein
MAVVINEFEAVAEPKQDKKDGDAAAADGAPKKIEPAQLRPPLRRIVSRQARLRAH